jgi:intracellular sulfur oxidation DsrE/DsrF family protein
MKQLFFFVLVLAISVSSKSQTKVNPAIKNFGSVYEIPNAAEKPDSKMKYKILVDITDGSSKPDTTNAYLEAVATLYNLHMVGGVSPKNMDLVVVFHKMATYTALNDEEYQKKFKVNNPNAPLLKELSDMGVKFFVCGQTMVRAKIPEDGLNPLVKEATSALTTLTTYQLKGYAMINFK